MRHERVAELGEELHRTGSTTTMQPECASTELGQLSPTLQPQLMPSERPCILLARTLFGRARVGDARASGQHLPRRPSEQLGTFIARSPSERATKRHKSAWEAASALAVASLLDLLSDEATIGGKRREDTRLTDEGCRKYSELAQGLLSCRS